MSLICAVVFEKGNLRGFFNGKNYNYLPSNNFTLSKCLITSYIEFRFLQLIYIFCFKLISDLSKLIKYLAMTDKWALSEHFLRNLKFYNL